MNNMTDEEIDNYLFKLEQKLLIESEKITIELTRNWAKSFPTESAVYLFREDDVVRYVGETGSLRGRMKDILNTKNHTLRRNIGNFYYSDFPSFEKASSQKNFPIDIEKLLIDKIENKFTVSYILVNLGRKELEERLFSKLKPRYCIKGKRTDQN